MEFVVWILMLPAAVLGFAEFVVVGIYVLVISYQVSSRKGNIKKALSLPDGVVFEKKNKSVTQACDYIESIFPVFEDPDAPLPKYRLGAVLDRRLSGTREILSKNGIIRKLRFVDVSTHQTEKGRNFRKWDQGGKEWCAYEMGSSAVEQYIDRNSGNVLMMRYHPSVYVRFSVSRRLRAEDKAAAAQKDKWGRKARNKDIFYDNMRLETCPSCGAKLPENLKDITCPFCNSTIFSDYYDWQVESLEIEPRKIEIRGFIGWIIYAWKEKSIVSQVKHNKKEKIVRFYENDFRQDVYDSVLEVENTAGLIDLRIGTIRIRSVKNTDKDTILTIKAPVYRVTLENGTVKSSSGNLGGSFIRARYPDRFRKDNAVVSAEKQCSSCGAPFDPDENGKCRYCGSFLYKDNIRWKHMDDFYAK